MTDNSATPRRGKANREHLERRLMERIMDRCEDDTAERDEVSRRAFERCRASARKWRKEAESEKGAP